MAMLLNGRTVDMCCEDVVKAVRNCCLLLVAALWATGLATSTPLRHLIQTAPIWIAVLPPVPIIGETTSRVRLV